jgi:hypothetical protein
VRESVELRRAIDPDAAAAGAVAATARAVGRGVARGRAAGVGRAAGSAPWRAGIGVCDVVERNDVDSTEARPSSASIAAIWSLSAAAPHGPTPAPTNLCQPGYTHIHL